MSRNGNIFLSLAVLLTIVIGGYFLSNFKIIKHSTEWAIGKIKSEEGKYDVIVVGSDPEGVAAAVAAARSGGQVLLFGKEDGPGGLLTYGMLNTLDMNRNSDKTILNKGIFSEFYTRIGKTESFDVEEAKAIFSDLIAQEENLTYKPNYTFSAPLIENNTIYGVEMLNYAGEKETFYGKRIIDATQDGDVCAAAGEEFYVGMEDVHWEHKMAATLVFKVGGVNWADIEADINLYKKETQDINAGFNKSTVWGFGKWCYDKYTPIHENMQLRGPNMGLQKDGTILINALQIFDVDGLDEDSKKKAMEDGKEEAENIVKYFREILPSFKDAYLVGVADQLYIRETRHIQGEYVLQATDLLGNTNFYDKIALGAYPLDIQATAKSNTGYVIGSPNQYSIPLRCIVPRKTENLMIVGRSASYSSVAAGSTRVVPTGMTVGESAGITAIYTIWKNMTPRELTQNKARIKQLISILKNQDVYLPEFNYGDPNGSVKGYEKIKKLINLGFLIGGYQNDFKFEKEANNANLCLAVMNGLQRGGNEKYNESMKQINKVKEFYSLETPLTGATAARVCNAMMGDYTEKTSGEMLSENFTSTEADLLNIARQKKKNNEALSEKESAVLARFEELNNERVKKIEEDVWKIVKEKGYFTEDFNKDDILTLREVYVTTVDILEKYIGRELGA
ncbi:MAG: FAD-dependent oxidoreductase [Clostridia bacterium]|nr:FAD-dependent oxidoreductase [Clostridia bacterium]